MQGGRQSDAPSTDPVVAFRSVSLRLGGTPVLHDLSFPVERGEILLLVGRSGAGKTSALLVRRATADSLDLETISDAAPHAGDWVPGMGYEFVEREDGLPGLVRAYDLSFASGPRTMELGLLYRALADRQVDVIAGNSTDGRIEALDLVHLRDDRGYFPPYEAVPVVRASVLEAHPELRASLRRLRDRISTAEMRRMNEAVNVDGQDYRQVAREWVEEALRADTGASGAGARPGSRGSVRP